VLTQWRNHDLEYTQPVVEFFAHMCSDFLTGRGEHASVYRELALAADPPHP
jgi:hypothetical protein